MFLCITKVCFDVIRERIVKIDSIIQMDKRGLVRYLVLLFTEVLLVLFIEVI